MSGLTRCPGLPSLPCDALIDESVRAYCNFCAKRLPDSQVYPISKMPRGARSRRSDSATQIPSTGRVRPPSPTRSEVSSSPINPKKRKNHVTNS